MEIREAPPLPRPAEDAVRLFQSGMEALQRHQYADAAESFGAVEAAFPGERALLDRSRVYLELCQRELRRKPTELGSPEERLTAATAALNNDDEARAEALVHSVLAEDAEHDLALYLSAAIHARRGQGDLAITVLRRAVAVSPDAGAQARLDPDFESLHHSEAFVALTAPPAAVPRRILRRVRH
jgi:tetratricopeptide (TPR) repeat protein